MPKTISIWLGIFWGLIALQAVLSYVDGFFAQSQIAAQGYGRGLAFVGHGQMWADILLSIIFVLIIKVYHKQWNGGQIYVCALISLGLSVLLHYMYVKASGEIPGCHAHDGYLTWAGWAHFVFQTLCFTVTLLFFFCSRGDLPDILITAALLFVHILVGAIEIPLYLGQTPYTLVNFFQVAGGFAALVIMTVVGLLRAPTH